MIRIRRSIRQSITLNITVRVENAASITSSVTLLPAAIYNLLVRIFVELMGIYLMISFNCSNSSKGIAWWAWSLSLDWCNSSMSIPIYPIITNSLDFFDSWCNFKIDWLFKIHCYKLISSQMSESIDSKFIGYVFFGIMGLDFCKILLEDCSAICIIFWIDLYSIGLFPLVKGVYLRRNSVMIGGNEEGACQDSSYSKDGWFTIHWC